ncbi:DNA polymerase III subunit delta [Fervidobacterium sp.]
MVIYLIGDSELGKELYIREYLKGRDVEYHKLFADDDVKIQELKNAASSLGLFSNSKVYDLVDFDEWNKAEKNDFNTLDLSANWLTVFVRTQKAGKDITKVDEKIEILNFEKPKEWEEEKWIKFIIDIANNLGITCDFHIAQSIFKFTGPDEYAILTELEKLHIYSDNHPTLSDVEQIVYKRTISKLDELGFAISEKKFNLAREFAAEISEEYEPVVIMYAVAKHFIDLFNILVYSPKKSTYNWPDISKIAKDSGIPSPKVARFLGFKFKDSKTNPVNHTLIYKLKEVREIIEYLYTLDRRIKLGDDLRLILNIFITALETGDISNPEKLLEF